MRIISWNCNGAFRRKFQHLTDLGGDIFVIQECEDPARSKDAAYRTWAQNHLWIGRSKHKGLGVFAHNGLALRAVPLAAGNLEYFLPCMVAANLVLLGIWAMGANSSSLAYIEQVWTYLRLHGHQFKNKKSLVVGDFNSNVCWDKKHCGMNHSDVVDQLTDIGLSSLYHEQMNEIQGQETTPTFYMYRKPEKSYHIDYAFLSACMLGSAKLDVGHPSAWLEHSDHMPLIMDVQE